MRISLIAALDEDGVIGRDGRMPWHLPADLKHFKATTLDKPVIQGRRTFEAIGKPLPRRRNIILTSHADFHADGVEAAHSPAQALEMARGAEEVMVIGGARVYAWFLPRADRLYLTRVHERIAGDTFFPDFDPAEWQLVADERRPADDKNPCALSFQRLERKRYE